MKETEGLITLSDFIHKTQDRLKYLLLLKVYNFQQLVFSYHHRVCLDSVYGLYQKPLILSLEYTTIQQLMEDDQII